MYGHHLEEYQRRIAAFGWDTILIDGHDFRQVLPAFDQAARAAGKPVMIIARTIKGKGVSFLEDQNGWHGKALTTPQLEKALLELVPVDKTVRGKITRPRDLRPAEPQPRKAERVEYEKGKSVATRKAYGNALKRLYPQYPRLVSLDGEVSNSTYAEIFKEAYPERFFEMYIAEQNMVGAALGLACRGQLPFVSTFAAFLSRAFDQIRMAQYSDANIKFCGSHAGVSIGQDGPSQMGLEDLAMMRAVLNSAVLYPCDAVSTEKLVEAMAEHRGMAYLRTTRMGTPVIYGPEEEFVIGGSKVLRRSDNDLAAVIAAGVTLFEALKAHDELQKEGINLRVIDLYSVKPVDDATINAAARQTSFLVVVEDHFPEGGMNEAVRSALCGKQVPVYSLAVRKKPRSGTPEELLDFEGISARGIVQLIKEVKQKL
jgi:transketolase